MRVESATVTMTTAPASDLTKICLAAASTATTSPRTLLPDCAPTPSAPAESASVSASRVRKVFLIVR